MHQARDKKIITPSTPRNLREDDYRGKCITVMGLGLHGGGVGVAKFLAKAGAFVTVTDLKTKKELAASIKKLRGLPIRYVLGRHDMKDFIGADTVIYSPGVRAKYLRLEDSPYLAAAITHGVKLETDLGIFLQMIDRQRIIGITGSKGKSTIAALIAHILRQKYPKTVLAGNIRTSVLDMLPKLVKGQRLKGESPQPIVLELSSWQLEGLAKKKVSPHIAVITNILHEHLNAYKSFSAYIEAKKHILRFQKKGDVAILNECIPPALRGGLGGCGRGKKIWFSPKIAQAYASALQIPGKHNKANLAAALAVVRLFKIPKQKILKALKTFKRLEGRLEIIRKFRGVTFINDTTATMPDATIAALQSFPDAKKIILIAGGVDKNFDYQSLTSVLAAHPPRALVLLLGSGTEKIRLAIHDSRFTIHEVQSMHEAVKAAWCVAKKGNTILLSPGAASFNLFQNEFDRGEKFVQEVKKLR